MKMLKSQHIIISVTGRFICLFILVYYIYY
jgi:hypothetical protein